MKDYKWSDLTSSRKRQMHKLLIFYLNKESWRLDILKDDYDDRKSYKITYKDNELEILIHKDSFSTDIRILLETCSISYDIPNILKYFSIRIFNLISKVNSKIYIKKRLKKEKESNEIVLPKSIVFSEKLDVL